MLQLPGCLLSIAVNSADENNKGVPAYIRIDSAKVVETRNDGWLRNHPVPSRKGTTIQVIPKDLAYFNDTIKITEVKNAYNISARVYRKKHRIEFLVRDKDTKQPLNDMTIVLGGDKAFTLEGYTDEKQLMEKTDQTGKAYFTFENVSVNNYTFIFRSFYATDYIPVAVNLSNEESKDFKKYIVELEKGSSISGMVTLDGQPVRNAKVYIDASQQATGMSNTPKNTTTATTTTPSITTMNATATTSPALSSNMAAIVAGITTPTPATMDMALISAYTDEQGRYTLRGVPVNNSTIDVLATLDAEFTVTGDSKKAAITDKKAENVNLALTKYNDMYINNLYGFPISIERIERIDANTAKVTGLVHWGAGISEFRVLDAYKQLRVEGVTFKAETVDGKKVGVATDQSIQMQGVTGLKLGYNIGNRGYNVMLKKSSTQINATPVPLTIERVDSKGAISGNMYIIDNSFNYTASYLNFSGNTKTDDTRNNFHFATIGSDGKVNNVIQTIISPLTEKETAAVQTFDNANTQANSGTNATSPQSGSGAPESIRS